MREYLRGIINNFELMQYETLSENSFIGAICRLNNFRVLVWGGGPRGEVAVKFLKMQDIRPDYIIDIDYGKRGGLFDNVEIIHPDDMPVKLDKNEKYYMVIATDFYLFPYDQNYIIRKCAENNIFDILDMYRKEYCGNYMLPYDVNAIDYYLKNVDKVLETLDMFEDEESQKDFCEFIRVNMSGDIWRLPEKGYREKYWGDGLFQLSDDETFVNCGSSVGDSIFHFIEEVHGKFQRIDAYEADENTVKRLKSIMKYIPTGMREKVNIYSQYLGNEDSDISLDTMYQSRKMTLVNMDIEGAEYNVLRGARNVLNEQKPLLAICVYHRARDIVEIPKLVKRYAPDYHLFLRKYVTTVWGIGTPSELVMYGIPTGRLKNGFKL